MQNILKGNIQNRKRQQIPQIPMGNSIRMLRVIINKTFNLKYIKQQTIKKRANHKNIGGKEKNKCVNNTLMPKDKNSNIIMMLFFFNKTYRHFECRIRCGVANYVSRFAR